MELIPSFQIDHERLNPGLYVSRIDNLSEDTEIVTYDLRFKAPNREPVMSTGAMHTIEHLGATFLRNDSKLKDTLVYFGPMGCRTGFYLINSGYIEPENLSSVIEKMCGFILGFEGDIPGAAPDQCGNWTDHDLPMSKYHVAKYLEDLKGYRRFNYPSKG